MGHKQSKLKNYCSEMDKQMLQIYNDLVHYLVN